LLVWRGQNGTADAAIFRESRRNGKPVARLTPVASTSSIESVRGAWRGRVRIGEDFDELPADIADAFGAR